jgi:hypothetical protein
MRYLGILLILFLVIGCVQESDNTYTVDEVWENKDKLANKTISVIGIANPGLMNCILGCDPDTIKEGGYCGACSGPLALKEEVPKKEVLEEEEFLIELTGNYKGEEMGCAGVPNNVKCYPLEIGKRYNVTGTLRVLEWGSYYGEALYELVLEVEAFKEY